MRVYNERRVKKKGKRQKMKDKSSCAGKKKAGKIVLRVLLGILCAVVVFIAVTSLITFIGNKATAKRVDSFSPVSYEKQLEPSFDEEGTVYFETDEEFSVMQLTDVHIGAGWMCLAKDVKAINAVAAMIAEEKPDLVIVTGDIAYPVPFQSGTINNKTPAKLFAGLMEKLGVYWTMCFGNHDTELYSLYDRDDMAEFYASGDYPHCLFSAGPEDVDGSCNHYINIRNTAGEVTETLFMIDSHSYMSDDPLGAKWHYDNIHENQLEWYKSSLDKVNAYNEELTGKKSDVKSLIFMHIPPVEAKQAWDEYAANGYADTENVKQIYGFAGGTGKIVFCSAEDDMLFETVKELGSTQGIFFGHDHRNNFSFDYKGVRLTYGMSIDYLAIPGIGKIGRQRGCTMITVAPDGSFESRNENYYQDKYVSLYEKEPIEMQEITYPYNGN